MKTENRKTWIFGKFEKFVRENEAKFEGIVRSDKTIRQLTRMIF